MGGVASREGVLAPAASGLPNRSRFLPRPCCVTLGRWPSLSGPRNLSCRWMKGRLAGPVEPLSLSPPPVCGLGGCRRGDPQAAGGGGRRRRRPGCGAGSCVSSDLDPPLEALSSSLERFC